MNRKIIEKLLINKNFSIREAMRLIDRSGWGMGFIVDDKKKFLGTATGGDIRRAILKGISIKKPIGEICNKEPVFVNEKTKDAEFLSLKFRKSIKGKIPIGGSLTVPVLDEKRKIKDVVFFNIDKDNKTRTFGYKDKTHKEGVKKVLLIGGAGYLGAIICRKLLNEGYQIRVLDNLSYGDWGIKELYEKNNFEFLKGDIRNVSDIVEAIKGVDAVIHLAAIVGDPACSKNPEETIEINYLATKIIAETCKYFQVNRFVFASTCSVYGKSRASNEVLTEESSLNPVSLYAETKIQCEKSILETMDENFSPTILRMATLYGYSPNMRFDLAINLMTGRALFDKKITVFGGEQWRPWLDLEDAASAYINCLEAPIEKVRGEIFNVLSENYKIIDVGRKINSVFTGAKLEVNNRKTDNRDYNVSFDKIYRILNFQPKKKIIDGVIEIKKAVEKGLIKNIEDTRYRTFLPQ